MIIKGNMKVNGKMEISMATEFILGPMEESILDSGKMVCLLEMGLLKKLINLCKKKEKNKNNLMLIILDCFLRNRKKRNNLMSLILI